MLVRCVLMSGCGGVGQARYVSLSGVCTVSDNLALHRHACVVRMELSGSVGSRRQARRAHLEERIHLLLCAHLIT